MRVGRKVSLPDFVLARVRESAAPADGLASGIQAVAEAAKSVSRGGHAQESDYMTGYEEGIFLGLRHAAAAFATHPDFDPAWSPTPAPTNAQR